MIATFAEPPTILTPEAPVVLPIVIVLAAASAPKLIAPVPVTKPNEPLVVVHAHAPLPELTLTAVAPVTLPIVIVLAAASAPKLIAPVPVTKPNEPLVVVQDGVVGDFPVQVQRGWRVGRRSGLRQHGLQRLRG